jgi:AraC-like DNA-binding protein
MADLWNNIALEEWKLYLEPPPYNPTADEGKKEGLPYAQWYRENREYHSWPELYFVMGGTELFGWGDRICQLPSYSIALISPYTSHAYLFPGGKRRAHNIWLSLGSPRASLMYYLKDREDSQLPLMTSCPIQEGVFPLIMDDLNRVNTSETRNHPLIKDKLRHLILAGLIQGTEQLNTEKNSADTPLSTVEQIKSFLEAHPGTSYSLQELATLAGYSKYHFHRMFKKQTGNTPAEYLRKRRISWAYELLKRGYSCKAAALEMGFSDPSAFSRWFKGGTGISPGQVMA